MEQKLTVISVNYNSSKYLNKLIKSLGNIKNLISEIIIIDNNSCDLNNLKINQKNFILIKNNKNLGFSKAVNQGIRKSTQNFILLLNPDTILIDNSIKFIFNKIKCNEKIGAIGGKIQQWGKDGYHLTANSRPTFFTGLFEFTNLKKIFPNNIFSKKFWIEKNLKIIKPVKVNSLCGAFILFRKKINNKLNLFDESFFLYLEDIKFGIDINENGFDVVFDPRAKIRHIGGASSNSKYHIVLKHWYKSRKILFKKLCNPIASGILNIIFLVEELFLKIFHLIKNEPSE